MLSLSQKFNLPPGAIIKENGLTAEICAGDILFIKYVCGVPYSVKPFDTAESVAKKFGVDKTELLEKNGVPYLFYGLTIYV